MEAEQVKSEYHSPDATNSIVIRYNTDCCYEVA